MSAAGKGFASAAVSFEPANCVPDASRPMLVNITITLCRALPGAVAESVYVFSAVEVSRSEITVPRFVLHGRHTGSTSNGLS